MLQQAAGQGAIDIHELDERLDAAYRAKTSGELAMVVHDLDLDLEPASAMRHGHTRGRGRIAAPLLARGNGPFRSAAFRYHATVYALTNTFLVGTWVMTTPGGFFWPFFPAAGWGIGLGTHALSAVTHIDRSDRRAAARATAGLPGYGTGAALAAPAPAATPPLAPRTGPVRRFVAVLFTDIVGSTALTQAIGDAEWAHLRGRHRELLLSCFAAHGGSEVSSAGDGFLARFDSARSAALAAVEIQRRLSQTRSEAGFAPQVRIGIHVGEAIEDDGDLLGTVINVASRITDEADAGEILCSDPVAEAVEGRVGVEDRGVRMLKGVARPRHLFALTWT